MNKIKNLNSKLPALKLGGSASGGRTQNSPVPASLICPLGQISRGKLLVLFILVVLSTINYQLPTLFAQVKDDLSSSFIYPNPVRASLGHDKVTFENLTNNVMIRIFKTNGDLIREINATDTTGTITWNLTNDNGNKVASGVYIYLITNESSQKFKGKIAIIR